MAALHCVQTFWHWFLMRFCSLRGGAGFAVQCYKAGVTEHYTGNAAPTVCADMSGGSCLGSQAAHSCLHSLAAGGASEGRAVSATSSERSNWSRVLSTAWGTTQW